MASNVINFEAARLRLRDKDSHLGHIFNNLQSGSDLRHVPDEVIVRWAKMLADADSDKTIQEVCDEVTRMVEEAKQNG